MDNLLRERKANRKSQIRKKPMKVVYISNPMKFEASASEFRALVQELTGQDAELPDPTKVVDADDSVCGRRMVPDASRPAEADDDPDHALEVSTVVDPSGEQPADVDGLLHPFDHDDAFMPQLLENFSGLMPSTFFIESTTHVDVLRSL